MTLIDLHLENRMARFDGLHDKPNQSANRGRRQVHHSWLLNALRPPNAGFAPASRRPADALSGRGRATPTRTESHPAASSTRPAAATNTSSSLRTPKAAAY